MRFESPSKSSLAPEREFSVESALQRLRGYFLDALPRLLQQPAGILRHPFFTPGGNYTNQLWDWDSFLMNRGLLALRPFATRDQFQGILDCGTGSWLNFFQCQSDEGKIPILITPDNGDFFSCTQDTGVETNQAKPVFGQFALDLVEAGVPLETFLPYLPALRKFHQSWIRKYRAHNGLLVWGSDAAIGTDNDPTVYGRPEFSSAHLLLNCLFHTDLIAVSQLAERCGEESIAGASRADAEALGEALTGECWDERDGFFYTVDVQCTDMRSRYIPEDVPRGMDLNWTSLPLKIQTFTGFLPMGLGLANRAQTERLARHFANPRTFNAAYGVRTLSADEKMYCPERESGNPSNWLGPIWIVANYLVWSSLKTGGLHEQASELAEKNLRLLDRDLQSTGTLHECYHPDTGRPNFNAGFLNWNALALVMTP